MTESSTLIFCFYTGQVEHTRLGIPTSTPLAVQQWDGLIAINYAARKFGVKRGDRTEAAKKKCPEIVFVHVETIGTGEDHRTVGAALPTTRDGGGAGRGGASGGASHDQRSCKVSLERCFLHGELLANSGRLLRSAIGMFVKPQEGTSSYTSGIHRRSCPQRN